MLTDKDIQGVLDEGQTYTMILNSVANTRYEAFLSSSRASKEVVRCDVRGEERWHI